MVGNKKITIAIDGPAASGKSTTAREVARRLGYTYIDSGAMYRAVTLKALQTGIDVNNFKKIEEIADKMHITFEKSNEKTIIFMDGIDVSEQIRTPQVDQNISPVAANAGVRKILVKKQQEMAATGGVVMDGRDIGTVVFPDAELKVFMIASVKERASRRKKELEQKGIIIDKDKVIKDIQYRDRQDATRYHGPLKKASDAIEIDTSKMSIPEQVEIILKLARGKLSALSRRLIT